jgi:hypothetical protein
MHLIFFYFQNIIVLNGILLIFLDLKPGNESIFGNLLEFYFLNKKMSEIFFKLKVKNMLIFFFSKIKRFQE